MPHLPEHQHELADLSEPANTAGKAQLGKRKLSELLPVEPLAVVGVPTPGPPVSVAVYSAAAVPPTAVVTAGTSNTSTWYRQRALITDAQRQECGEPPKRRNKKLKDFYACGICNEPKKKETGHTQFKGTWYCPNNRDLPPFEEWKAAAMSAAAAKKAAKDK